MPSVQPQATFRTHGVPCRSQRQASSINSEQKRVRFDLFSGFRQARACFVSGVDSRQRVRALFLCRPFSFWMGVTVTHGSGRPSVSDQTDTATTPRPPRVINFPNCQIRNLSQVLDIEEEVIPKRGSLKLSTSSVQTGSGTTHLPDPHSPSINTPTPPHHRLHPYAPSTHSRQAHQGYEPHKPTLLMFHRRRSS